MLRAALAGQRADLVPAALLVIGHQLAEAAVPVVVGAAIDLAVGTGDVGALLWWLAAVVGVFVLLISCGSLGYWLLARAELRAGRAVRLRVAARALDAGGGALGRPGELVGMANSDADRTAEACVAFAVLAGTVAALVAGSVVLLRISGTLAAAVLIGLAVVLVLSRFLARPLAARAEAEQEGLARATGTATDLVRGLRVIKGIGAEHAAAAGYRLRSQTALQSRLHAARLEGGYLGATAVLTGGLLILVAAVGGRLALAGTITIGELVAALGLAQFLMEPLQRLTDLGPLVAGARGAAARVADVLATPLAVRSGPGVLPAGPAVLPAGPAALAVRHRALEFTVRAGEHVGVVTDDPRVATGLLDVLAREAEPEGWYQLEGTDLREVALADTRAAVVVARHDAVIFEGALRDNLGAGSKAPSSAALTASAADEVVDALPDGLDTILGEAGRTLSGGQRQRVALARALAADAPVLVLHEPTTAVDAATENRIADGVRRARAGRTTLVVTSSPALLARCDRVLLVVDGAVAATGSHAELLGNQRYRAAVLA